MIHVSNTRVATQQGILIVTRSGKSQGILSDSLKSGKKPGSFEGQPWTTTACWYLRGGGGGQFAGLIQMYITSLDSHLVQYPPLIVCLRYINNLTSAEEKLTTEIAYLIVAQQQRHLVISPWSLMAAVLMQSGEGGISVKQLTKEAEWLKRQAYSLGAYVDWPGESGGALMSITTIAR